MAPGVKRWTAREVHQMLEQGLIHDGDPYELIDGLLVFKNRAAAGEPPMTHGSRHIVTVMQLQRLDRRFDERGYFVQTQLPIAISDDDEPEPDAAIVRGRPQDYRQAMASGADCRLVVEVADSSLRYDRRIKQRTYAAAGIPEYWIVNLRNNTVEVYEQPDRERGEYRVRRDRQPGETIEVNLPDGTTVAVHVDEVLG
jgi:Uma2 family endonuclease